LSEPLGRKKITVEAGGKDAEVVYDFLGLT